MKRARREGMILLNVLIVVAIAAVTVTVMIVAQDIQVRRSVRLHDAAQAQSYARAGELSAVAALRRDALTGPGMDGYGEPWAAVAQRPIGIPGGRFALSITDEQARFNANLAVGGDPTPAVILVEIGRVAGVQPATIQTLLQTLALLGPIRDDGPLRTAGVDPADLERLRPWIAFLPPEAKVNLNTADPALLALILRDPDRVRQVVARRGLQGGLTAEGAAALASSPLVGVTSDNFRVRTEVAVGDVTRRTESLLARSRVDDRVTVAVTARRRVGP